MPDSESSKYAENQALNATVDRFPLMGELLADTVDRAQNATSGTMEFSTPMSVLLLANTAWVTGYNAIATAEAAYRSTTLAMEDKFESLTRPPDADNPSVLEKWDSTIRNEVAYQGTTYTYLLPNGREAFTTGTITERIHAIKQLADRLAEQTTKPALVTLAAAVATFHTDLQALRSSQIFASSEIEVLRVAQEQLRITAAAAIYSLLGFGMYLWSTTPERVDTLWNVNILRNPAQNVPAAPGDTTWTPGTRTLSTTAMPEGATRLEAWRIAPGGMPELLLTGGFGETELIIPATITFPPDGVYQLWLQGVNSRGHSEPGPIQSWTPV